MEKSTCIPKGLLLCIFAVMGAGSALADGSLGPNGTWRSQGPPAGVIQQNPLAPSPPPFLQMGPKPTPDSFLQMVPPRSPNAQLQQPFIDPQQGWQQRQWQEDAWRQQQWIEQQRLERQRNDWRNWEGVNERGNREMRERAWRERERRLR